MNLHVNKRGTRRYISFRCRRSVGNATPCTRTQVRAFAIEQKLESIFRKPVKEIPKKRGRPPRSLLALYALGQIFCVMDLPMQRRLIERAVKEITWDADADRIRVSFTDVDRLEALRGLPNEVLAEVGIKKKSESSPGQKPQVKMKTTS